jgi:hypothetical protein
MAEKKNQEQAADGNELQELQKRVGELENENKKLNKEITDNELYWQQRKEELEDKIEALKQENEKLKVEILVPGKVEERENVVDPRLLEKACKAYGIDKQYVFSSAIGDDGAVVIVTNGGSKVRWFEGDKPEPLDQIAVTGINPKAAKRKVVAGKAKK